MTRVFEYTPVIFGVSMVTTFKYILVINRVIECRHCGTCFNLLGIEYRMVKNYGFVYIPAKYLVIINGFICYTQRLRTGLW